MNYLVQWRFPRPYRDTQWKKLIACEEKEIAVDHFMHPLIELVDGCYIKLLTPQYHCIAFGVRMGDETLIMPSIDGIYNDVESTYYKTSPFDWESFIREMTNSQQHFSRAMTRGDVSLQSMTKLLARSVR